MNVPEELKYTKDHEWIKIDGNTATVGITHFAQGVFGSVEAVKTVSDLLMPLTGEVIEFNEALEDEPEKVNSDPYGDGWMIKIAISDASEIDELLSSEQYTKLIGA